QRFTSHRRDERLPPTAALHEPPPSPSATPPPRTGEDPEGVPGKSLSDKAPYRGAARKWLRKGRPSSGISFLLSGVTADRRTVTERLPPAPKVQAWPRIKSSTPDPPPFTGEVPPKAAEGATRAPDLACE